MLEQGGLLGFAAREPIVLWPDMAGDMAGDMAAGQRRRQHESQIQERHACPLHTAARKAMLRPAGGGGGGQRRRGIVPLTCS